MTEYMKALSAAELSLPILPAFLRFIFSFLTLCSLMLFDISTSPLSSTRFIAAHKSRRLVYHPISSPQHCLLLPFLHLSAHILYGPVDIVAQSRFRHPQPKSPEFPYYLLERGVVPELFHQYVAQRLRAEAAAFDRTVYRYRVYGPDIILVTETNSRCFVGYPFACQPCPCTDTARIRSLSTPSLSQDLADCTYHFLHVTASATHD